jgi:CheY-like chemotaxis protein
MAIMDQMKILLVDDSKSARYALRLQLQRHGIDVETADSAESAFEMLKGELPDAILMDHMMPGLNGFEALEAIRSDARTAHLPVVMCTSHEDADFAATALRKGVIGILPKSVAPEKLPEILNRLRQAVATAGATAVHPSPRPAPVPAAAPSAPPPMPPGLGKAEVLRLIDERIDERVNERVDERIEARLAGLLAPLLEDLRRDLGERVQAEARALVESRLAETRHQIEAKLADERMARDSARSAKDIQELEGVASRLVEEALPDIVKVEIESERAEILGLVEQYMRELGPQGQTADLSPERLAALDGVIASKAQHAAQRAAQEAIEAGIDRTNRIADAMMDQVQTNLRLIYLAILGAGLVGTLSATAVYFLLR